jgi:hypothetical protein
MPTSTFRAWVVGLIWAVVIPGANQFFYFRFPSVTITAVCLPPLFESVVPPLLNQVLAKKIVPQLLTFPLCKLWARYMPKVTVFGVSLNPGPFTIKEHVIITIMASVGAQSAYAVSAAQAVNPYLFLHLLYLDRHHRRPKGFL